MRKNITAFIVGLNEVNLLSNALPRIAEVDELIYIDLQSSDDSIQVAKSFGAKVIVHEPVPIVELIHAELIDKCRNDWVLLTDPDEVIDSILIKQLSHFINTGEATKIGMVVAPIQFYFKNKPLSGTIWGGKNSRVILVNKERIAFTGNVHRGRHVKEGFTMHTISAANNNIIHHFWMSSYGQLYKKHLRYLNNEGKSMYEAGQRASIKNLVKTPFTAFKECFISKSGFKDGFVGLGLSVFWVWYKTSAYVSLIKYQQLITK